MSCEFRTFRAATETGFFLELNPCDCCAAVTVVIGLPGYLPTTARVDDAEFGRLVDRFGIFGRHALDWLLAHEDIGGPRFRAALGFLDEDDPLGWQEWDGVAHEHVTAEDE